MSIQAGGDFERGAALNDKVAVVTGASSGIGEATARRLAGLGYTVYAAARRVERMAPPADAGIWPVMVDAHLRRVHGAAPAESALVLDGIAQRDPVRPRRGRRPEAEGHADHGGVLEHAHGGALRALDDGGAPHLPTERAGIVLCQKITLPMLSSSARSETLRLWATWSAVCGYLATITNADGESRRSPVEAEQVRLGTDDPDMTRLISSSSRCADCGRPAISPGMLMVVWADTRTGAAVVLVSGASTAPTATATAATGTGRHPSRDAALGLERGVEPLGSDIRS